MTEETSRDYLKNKITGNSPIEKESSERPSPPPFPPLSLVKVFEGLFAGGSTLNAFLPKRILETASTTLKRKEK